MYQYYMHGDALITLLDIWTGPNIKQLIVSKQRLRDTLI